MRQGRLGLCVIGCVSVLGCGDKGEGKGDARLTERPIAASRAALAMDATLMTTYEEVQIPYLGVERTALTPEQQTAVSELAGELHGALLPLDSAQIPAGLSSPQRFTLITERGPIHAAPSRALMMSNGASEAHIFYVCDIPAGVSEQTLSMIAVPYDAKLPAAARVRAGEMVGVESEVGKVITAYIRPLVTAQADAARQAEGGAESQVAAFVPAEHIQIVRGQFGGGKTLLVAYAVPRSADAEDISLGHFSGLFLTDDSGKNIEVVVGELSFEEARIGDLVDLEGDGVDEARFSVGYYEGNYEFLLYAKGGAHANVTLSGDGA